MGIKKIKIKIKIKTKIKLETVFKNKKLIGLNEIQIHTKLPIQAIRFSLSVDGRIFPDLIGDGAVVATPFGSTGYYKSTGGKRFQKGIGISFNNLHNKKIRSIVVPERSIIEVELNRGPAWILADNNEEIIELENNDISIIRKSKSVANFIHVL